MQKRLHWIALASVAALAIAAYLLWPRGPCGSEYGLRLPQCPDGELRQTLRIRGQDLRRGGEGTVHITATAVYTVAKSDEQQYAGIERFDVALALVDGDGREMPVEAKDGWKAEYGERWATITLPPVTDGDYLLRARVRSKVAESSVDLPLALYAPARIHVLTDRPLYEPGNEVKFRALVVRARDLLPIDERPGMWLVRDPTGEVLLEEKAPAGAWGVVAGSFPLDAEAATGMWSVTWQSGNDQETVSFKVEPFTLPRFRVEAAAPQPYYRPGERPSLTGSVVYSSGAPVEGAVVHIDWLPTGAWPPPTSWLQGELPTRVDADRNGSFDIELPEVPADLIGQATLIARMSAVDPAGDRVEGTAQVLLSEDAIQVQAVTELGGGLVENANNRVYLRVTTADGAVLSGASIEVKPAWSPGDAGISAELDQDGVARVQLDPGPPVNVVVPAMPVRAAASSPGQLVTRTSVYEMVLQEGASLADQVAMDRWLAPLEACAKWVEGAEEVNLGVRVTEQGAVVAGVAGDTPLAECALAVVRRQRLPAGPARLYSLGFQFQAPPLPRLDVSLDAPVDGVPGELEELFARAALDARDCLPGDVDAELPWVLSWQVQAGQKKLQTSWLRVPGEVPMPARAAECISARVARQSLAEEAAGSSLGVAHFSLSSGVETDAELRPQPTIMKGYELLVSASVQGQPFGSTRLRMQPGRVPTLRVRANPVLAEPGQEVEFTVIRGPDFTGDVPDKLYLSHFGDREELKLDDKQRTVTYKLPDDAEGWYEAEVQGNRALVYVRPRDQLSVAVDADKPRYSPGATARLAIQTRVGSRGAPAAVGLFGVDQSLGQLAALPGADELGGLRPKVSMKDNAFGVLEAGALALGRIRGPYAAEATILRVGTVPLPAEIDVVIDNTADTVFDPVAELTDRFYIALAELHAQTRVWEESAPADQQMEPEIMAELWDRALDAVAARGQSVEDAFGRRMRLHRLPYDLLSLTDPRQVVVVGTRLPEDVENWTQWVEEHRP